MHFIFRTTLVVCTLLCLAVQAPAATRTFLVLPFSVSGPAGLSYLEQAVPSMLNSRLYVKGQTQAVPGDKYAAIKDSAAAKAALQKSGADYLIWGAMAAQDDNVTVDMRLIGKDGAQWKRVSKTTLNALITTLQGNADAIKAEVFGMGGRQASQTGRPVASAPMNPAFVSNETQQRQVYLNPQFRYQGVDSARMRSQPLPFAAVGMEVADVNGDGKNEVVLLGEHKVHVYQWGTDRMKQIGEMALPMTDDAVAIRTIDMDRDRAAEIVVSMVDRDQTMPRSYILSFKNNQFSTIGDRLPYYLNVVKLAPDFSPTLIGQRGEGASVFSTKGIFEILKNGASVVEGRKINLPKDANVLNFAWLPGGAKGDGDKLIVLTKDERFATYSDRLSRLYLSDEKYSGSAIGIDNQTNMPGLGKDSVVIPRQYYVPLRMIPVDLEQRGDYTLLVNKPISVAAQFFDRYRFFPEGEIHDMFWDGVGLSLLWKTRRIKGSVVDFGVGDLLNDGTNALVVCLNTHPGALGFSKRKTVVMAYPLDLGQTDPNTPPLIEQ